MRLVTAVIKPFKLDDVKDALSQVGVQGLTVTEVRGFGRQKGHRQQHRGAEYAVDLIPKLKLEKVITDYSLSDVNSARTGEIGEGKIFVYSLDSTVRIRTGEKGEKAIY